MLTADQVLTRINVRLQAAGLSEAESSRLSQLKNAVESGLDPRLAATNLQAILKPGTQNVGGNKLLLMKGTAWLGKANELSTSANSEGVIAGRDELVAGVHAFLGKGGRAHG